MTKAHAQQISLNLIPEQCVSVHQGEKCYVDVVIKWQAQAAGDYCLYADSQQLPLQCWQASSAGHFEQEFVTHQNITFTIKPKGSDNPMTKKTLKMAWVYKKNVRSRMTWRLF
ncbi:DUF3019 domain-containing protein [Thalassotalea ganghwensis]